MKKITTLLIGICLLLTAIGCQNPFQTGDVHGKGRFVLNLNDGRTIMPAINDEGIVVYTLKFSGKEELELDRTAANLGNAVSLESGTYSLTVTAYSDEAKANPVARGTLTGIVITSGGTTSRNLVLKGIVEEGATGTFKWKISFSEMTVSMTITPLDAGYSAQQSPAITNGEEGSVTLNAGYYRVTFNLNDGSRAVSRNDYLHIYKNMESYFEFTFSEEHFVIIGTGQYASTDVLGNTYSISIGSNASGRAALKHDRFSMNVTGRDGKTRKTYGRVKNISSDGTLTLETDEGVEFTAVVDDDGDSLDSVASDCAEIPFIDELNNEAPLVPRTFDKIYLRANRWSSDNIGAGKMHGEQWGSGLTVLVKDFPTNVSRLEAGNNNRYTITVSGTADKAIDHARIEVQGLTEDDEWVYLAGTSNEGTAISAGQFNITYNLEITSDPVSLNLLDYKEIILQTTNVLQMIFDDHPEWNADIDYGSLPAEIPNGQIMATISDFKISLKDTYRDAFKGNTNDYTYGYKEDGFSVNYQLAVWSLTPENIAAVKKQNANAIFEFIMMDVDDILDPGTTLCFAWQDPVRELWWQDEITISDWTQTDGWHLADGVLWNPWRKKVTIDLSKVIKDSRFAASTELNFIIGCWWNNEADCKNISDLTITGANIYSLPTCAGNMGNYVHGVQGDGISIEYNSIDWHLSPTILTAAQKPGAKLVLEFSKDISNTGLALVWQDSATERWWPSDEEQGTDSANLYIYRSGESLKTGVTYDSTAKKLTVVLEQALETYSDSAAKPDAERPNNTIGFESATDATIKLHCWWWGSISGENVNITELGIVSANIVMPLEPVTITDPSFEGWGGLGGETGSTFEMVKEPANTYPCRTTYQFLAEASAYSKFTVSYTVTKTADTGNKVKLIFSDYVKDGWDEDKDKTFEAYADHTEDGIYTCTYSCTSNNSFTIAINKYDDSDPTADFSIVIDSIKFHD